MCDQYAVDEYSNMSGNNIAELAEEKPGIGKFLTKWKPRVFIKDSPEDSETDQPTLSALLPRRTRRTSYLDTLTSSPPPSLSSCDDSDLEASPEATQKESEDTHQEHGDQVIKESPPAEGEASEGVYQCAEDSALSNSVVFDSRCQVPHDPGVDSNRNLQATKSQQNYERQANVFNGHSLHGLSKDDVDLLTLCRELEKNPTSIFYRRTLESYNSKIAEESASETAEETGEGEGEREEETEGDAEIVSNTVADLKETDSQVESPSQSSLPLPRFRQLRTFLSRKQKETPPTMPITPRFTQLRNRQASKETKNYPKTESDVNDEWADIPSLDAVSVGSSQADVASTSTEDSSSKRAHTSKSSLEERFHPETESMQSSPASGSEWSSDQRKVYEMQLENLQEQLVDIMIENQTLAQKLQRYDNSDIIPLLKKLEEERDRNENLTQRYTSLEKCLKSNRSLRQASIDAEEAAADAAEHDDTTYIGEYDGPPPTRWERLQNYVVDGVFTILADFTEDAEESEMEASTEGDELSVKKLKENMKRFKSGYEPGLMFFKALAALVSWQSSSLTFLAFLIYVYIVWTGWSATVLLGLMVWYLTTTYFISRGWTIEFSFLPYNLVEVTPDEGPPLSMSDKFQLVLHVSRKAQNLLGHLADFMERSRNFLYWANPDLTLQLYRNLVVAFVASWFISGATLLTVVGLFVGVKVFLMNPVLKRYPRLKAKYSLEQKIFKEVPTNAELEQRRAIEETEQFLIPEIEGITIRLAEEVSPDPKPASKRWVAFSQAFSLPESEQPLPGWKDGKRCTLINKSTGSMSAAFKNGRMYLTKSFLCFEKSRLLSEGNMMIPLKDVTRIEKAKPFSFFQGSGMSVEIHLASSDKPVLFGGILNRNQVHDKIVATWQAAQRALQHQRRESERTRRESQSSSQRDGGGTAEDTGDGGKSEVEDHV